MVTKEELVHNFVAKDVKRTILITVAGEMFVEYDKEIDNSNQIIKENEDNIGDNKFKNDNIDKVCANNVKEICSEEDVVYKTNSIDRYPKILNDNKRELQSNN